MTNLIDRIYNKVFNTRILRKPKSSYFVDPDVKDEAVSTEYLDVKLIVMSHETHMEVMRLDYSGSTGVSFQQDKSQPYRLFGIRIAFDDSLPFGEVLVAGEVA
jgi:hypothetical protein